MPLRFLSLPLEMLVVLHPAPVAAPAESIRGEDFFAVVVYVDFVREILASIHEFFCRRRLD